MANHFRVDVKESEAELRHRLCVHSTIRHRGLTLARLATIGLVANHLAVV
jgi:hypothetical protein